ncbi:putative FBD-associated F-box protein At5g56440 [Trifolium pratense]|uniref:putative FBD-associated F-box protein At5g56440 n=1 Tax=Trifolium pratense TaxID=57577 RepID=UPI001E69357C|nr:putative FBD-associated F-box protein At5g56440 [Trifolium pratense]
MVVRQKSDFPDSGRILKRSKPLMSDSALQDKDTNDAVEGKDKFEDMPNCVVLHTLSFMETKDAVRTCVLSKRWRNLWTGIPCLNFNSKSFSRLVDFRRFVVCVLSRRDSSAVKVLNYSRTGVDYATDQNLFNKVIDYVTSHGVEEIRVNLRAKGRGSPPVDIPLSLFNCVSLKKLQLKDCHPSKATWILPFEPPKHLLHLKQFTLDPTAPGHPYSFAGLANIFGFATLTTLNLCRLTLSFTGYETLNPFENCLNLKNLLLREIRFMLEPVPEDFVISAPQLNNLTLMCCRFFKCNLVIAAPKLISFNYLYAAPGAMFEFNIPSVHNFTINICEPQNKLGAPHQKPGEKTKHGLIKMFREGPEAELSFSTAVVSCGAVIMPKKKCPSCCRCQWKALNLRVGSTYKVFVNKLDQITAYFRHCSQHGEYDVLSI